MFERRERPRRPAVPAALYALAAVIAVERVMLRSGVPWLDGMCGRACAGVMLASLVVCIVLRVRGKGSAGDLALLVCVAVASAFVLSSTALARGSSFAEAMGSTPVTSWDFVIKNDGSQKKGSYRYRARASDGHGHAEDVWLTLPERVGRGSTVRCSGAYVRPGDGDWDVSSRMQGVWGSVRAFSLLLVEEPYGLVAELWSLRECVLASVEPGLSSARALVAGAVCGSREDLEEQGLDDVFARCGIAHLVSVSGGHLSVLTLMVSSFLEAVGVGRRMRSAIVLGVSGAFVLFCGAPLSAVRAFLMVVVATVGELAGRRSHGLSSVSIVALAMALWDPALSGQVGFLLSVTSVCALCLFGPYATYAFGQLLGDIPLPQSVPSEVRRRLLRTWRGVRASMATSVLVLVATLPLTASTFGEVSLVGPAANALLSTPFTILLGMGIVAAALWWLPPLQTVVLVGVDVLGGSIVRLARLLSQAPFSSLPMTGDLTGIAVATAAGATVLLVVWPRVSRKAVGRVLGALCLVAAIVFARWRYFAPARICVLDVGQGDAILVQDGAHALLVDAGPGDAVVEALMREHVVHVDGVLVTHLHEDHYGGVPSVVTRWGCDKVVVAQGVGDGLRKLMPDVVDEGSASEVCEVGYGDFLQVGGYRLRMVSPTDVVDGTENAHSAMLLVEFEGDGRELSGLLTGDAERDELAGLLERGDVGDIDFLKVGHHGSEVSITAAQAAVLDPEVAVASAGEGNSYGHPTETCIRVLEDAGALFVCTKDVGDVEVRPGNSGPVVSWAGG